MDAQTQASKAKVMELVELDPLRNALVGLPGRSGLSVEARKRLTIAVELVANPSVVFMDVRPSPQIQVSNPVKIFLALCGMCQGHRVSSRDSSAPR